MKISNAWEISTHRMMWIVKKIKINSSHDTWEYIQSIHRINFHENGWQRHENTFFSSYRMYFWLHFYHWSRLRQQNIPKSKYGNACFVCDGRFQRLARKQLWCEVKEEKKKKSIAYTRSDDMSMSNCSDDDMKKYVLSSSQTKSGKNDFVAFFAQRSP